ncbi:ABC transporter permease subunit/CPBP intramembrane protease [Candidatus Laterigemmans baculatus]|uniref:ABC transporter permease subunit/CPBP intramembrane protease n=1 Tax=Candidatus Laterigemmans baculatus TaxID=2770505 RepID=UPI0013D98E4E|nr:ABC transporter permease subunit/CPBP intramembrane protease [Candidatus Laterigemmans baculatus]
MKFEHPRPRLSTVMLVYLREMRDQLRDRRTIFTIAVLPLVLYPLVGSVLLQVAQFTQEHPTSVCLIGGENLPSHPPLLAPAEASSSRALGRFADTLDEQSEGIHLVQHPLAADADPERVRAEAEEWVRSDLYHIVLWVPPGFTAAADGADQTSAASGAAALAGADALVGGESGSTAARGKSLQVFYNVASDPSRVAHQRIMRVLSAWRDQWVQERLDARGLDAAVLSPFGVETVDIAPKATRDAAFWSKLLPFVMLVWAMTGAFYPAIDLVAGEKERGTLETLLCSPALRSEIVMGKLAAVTTFSTLTAMLNVSSMLVTSLFVFRQVMPLGPDGGSMGLPPLVPMLWLLVALFPLSALFSALALAIAALARSSKEGQYYLMPLMMVSLPLVLLPLLPGTTLNAGTSLIPVTGMFLLARALVEGQYWAALIHLPLVAGVTLLCLWMATRWARRQFEDETVLFRGGEQWNLSGWVRHLWRDREGAATVGQALMCATVILVGMFFAKLVVTGGPTDWTGILQMVLLPQVGLILAPTLLMACVLTRSMRQSLRVRRPAILSLPVAVLLGVALHPTYMALGQLIQQIYPLSDAALAALQPFERIVSTAPLWQVIIVLAVVPAICEELAFRGFMFSGLVRDHGRLRAIVGTSVLFGMSHGVLQQSMAATVMGVLLAWIALRTGSILPGLLVHLTNNALSVSLGRLATSDAPWVRHFLSGDSGEPAYRLEWVLLAGCIAVLCLVYFSVVRSCEPAELGPDDGDEVNEPATAATPALAG